MTVSRIFSSGCTEATFSHSLLSNSHTCYIYPASTAIILVCLGDPYHLTLQGMCILPVIRWIVRILLNKLWLFPWRTTSSPGKHPEPRSPTTETPQSSGVIVDERFSHNNAAEECFYVDLGLVVPLRREPWQTLRPIKGEDALSRASTQAQDTTQAHGRALKVDYAHGRMILEKLVASR